jgi:hypothetical protein
MRVLQLEQSHLYATQSHNIRQTRSSTLKNYLIGGFLCMFPRRIGSALLPFGHRPSHKRHVGSFSKVERRNLLKVGD